MGSKENPGIFDCYDKAEPNEPMFTLLARDYVAPGIIREWVSRRGLSELSEKALEALKCANDMEEWRRKNGDG